MILEEETFKIFGYYPHDLKPQSGKRILVKCDDCGKIRECSKLNNRPLCRSCGHKPHKLEPKGTYHIEEGMLEDETFAKFGYYPSQLKPRSRKIILVKCGKCGNIRENSKHRFRTLCMSCVQIGKTPSEETRKKLSIASKGKKHTKEHHRKIAIANTGKKRSEEACKKFSSVAMGRIPSEETRKKLSIAKLGERNGNWKGGISFEPYCEKFNKQFKEYIRDKFGRICFICGKTEKENGTLLSVHHVNYDKDCMCNDNLTCQFIPLCKRHNGIVNSNRDEWEVKLNAKMKNQLKGWYI